MHDVEFAVYTSFCLFSTGWSMLHLLVGSVVFDTAYQYILAIRTVYASIFLSCPVTFMTRVRSQLQKKAA